MNKHNVQEIDILHIDTEGFDYNVLSQIDFIKHKPYIILYENKHLRLKRSTPQRITPGRQRISSDPLWRRHLGGPRGLTMSRCQYLFLQHILSRPTRERLDQVVEDHDPIVKHSEAPALGESTWALADQGVVSVGNFLTMVLLARNLPPGEYGLFSLIYGVLLFLNSIHSSLITYPLSVRGASADGSRLQRYAGRALLLTLFVGAGLSPLLSGVVWALNQASLIPWALLTLLFWQMQETVRRGFMAHQRFQEALWGDGLCYLGQAAAIWVLSEWRILDLEHVFGVIAATSLMAGTLQFLQLRPRLESPFSLRLSAGDFWLLGRWVLMINLLNLLTIQFFPWMLMLFHGAGDVAAFQALGNVMAVANPIIFCLGSLMLPVAAKVAADHGVSAAWQRSRDYALQGAVLLLPYFAALLIWPGWFLCRFYGCDSAYSGLSFPLRIFVAAYALNYLAQMVGNFLNGIREGRSAFLAQAASATTVLLLGPPLVCWAGITGALSGMAVMNAVRAACGAGFLAQRLKCTADAR